MIKKGDTSSKIRRDTNDGIRDTNDERIDTNNGIRDTNDRIRRETVDKTVRGTGDEIRQ